jgi:menaquinone-specific isochorismate synthase
MITSSHSTQLSWCDNDTSIVLSGNRFESSDYAQAIVHLEQNPHISHLWGIIPFDGQTNKSIYIVPESSQRLERGPQTDSHQSFKLKPFDLEDILTTHQQTVARALSVLKDPNNPLQKLVIASPFTTDYLGELPFNYLYNQLLSDRSIYETSIGVCLNGEQILLNSPETLIQSNPNGGFTLDALAGTARRTQTDDHLVTDALLNSPKDRLEHQLVIDDIKSRFPGVITYPKDPFIRSLKTLHHLYTPLNATVVDSETSIGNLLESLTPTAALGGLPQGLAVEKIRQLESSDRGYYGGTVFIIDQHQNLKAQVVIRALFARPQTQTLTLYAGGGIVETSQPTLEALEVQHKLAQWLGYLTACETAHV